MNRVRSIEKTSIAGIAVNLLLAAAKLIIGVIAHSVSIRTDGIHSITAALTSIITFIGARLSVKEPDRRHPFGYGRVEYLSTLLIGMFIIYAGAGAVIESIQDIMKPDMSDYSTLSLVVIAVAVIVRIALGVYTRRKGAELGSEALTASGKDAIDDSIGSGAVIIAALVYMTTGVDIEAYASLLISFMIIRTGIETLKVTVSTILGERVPVELASSVRESIMTFPEVDDVFGIAIHNYGIERKIGSAHVEISDAYTAAWIDNLQREIAKKVKADTGVEMMGISIFAVNSRDSASAEMREAIRKIAMKHEEVLGVHGFYVDKVDKAIKFRLTMDFNAEDSEDVIRRIKARVHKKYPGYDVEITPEHELTEDIN